LEVARRHSLAHVPALDGLRGLALLGVLLFHANGALVGGYLGVDLFFVLSGYLITSILLAEHQATGRIELGAFWVRRARRLFPALLSLMPAIALYARFCGTPADLVRLRGDALATLAYVANWRAIVSHASYWALFAAPSPLEHTWSLSIEEQFYVVWPLVVVALLRRGARRRVLVASLALAAVSAALTLSLYDPANTSRVYFGTDTRAAGILVGSALAALLPMLPIPSQAMARAVDALGVVAAVVLGVAWCTLNGESPRLYHGGLWLTELAALALIVACVQAPHGLVARALRIKPLTVLGTISYGVYLWHWPINVFLTEPRTHLHGPLLQLARIAVALGVAAVSYRLLERPIQLRGVPFGRPLYIVPAVITLSVLLVVRATYAGERSDVSPVLPLPKTEIESGANEPQLPPMRVMLVGDSTANSLGWALRGVQRRGAEMLLKGQDGCTILADTCGGSSWATDTKDFAPDRTLVVLGGAFMHGITVNGTWSKACTPVWDERFESMLARRLQDLASPNGRVWVVTAPYALGPWDVSEIRHEVDCINRSIRKAATGVPQVSILDLADHLCPNGRCAVEADGKIVRPDGVHYDIDGATALSRWVFEQLE
jgi:peptidoglycan/LPS O-acetylase OafA/YrhL